jgi:SAM-dependent methyltransferase
MEKRGMLYSLLSLPAVYRCFRLAVMGDSGRIYVSDYVKPVAGEKVLDMGCGPGDIMSYLPAVDYLGFDINADYIEAARERFGKRGRFFCGDVGLVAIDQEVGTFDLVMATGVLHHLDDGRAARLFELAYKALKPGGRLITYDGCYVAGQPRLARFVVSRDRGEFVRGCEDYARLAAGFFSKVEAFVRHDLLRIPYTHLIMRCHKQA